MSLKTSLSLNALRFSAWMAQSPAQARAVSLAVALGLALAAAVLNTPAAFADPYGGGGSTGG